MVLDMQCYVPYHDEKTRTRSPGGSRLLHMVLYVIEDVWTTYAIAECTRRHLYVSISALLGHL